MPNIKRTYRRSLSLLLAVVQLLVLFALPVSASEPDKAPVDLPSGAQPLSVTLDVATGISTVLSAFDGDPDYQAAYIQFTPTEDGTYQILAQAALASGVTAVGSQPILICKPADFEPVGMGNNNSAWSCYSNYALTANTAYTFRVLIPKTGLDTAQPINVKVSKAQGGGSGGGDQGGGPGYTDGQIYLGLQNGPGGMIYIQAFGNKYKYPVDARFYLCSKDQNGESFTQLTDHVTLAYYPDALSGQADDGTLLSINEATDEAGRWTLQATGATSGTLKVSYNGTTSDIALDLRGGPDVPKDVTPQTLQTNDTLTLTASMLQDLEPAYNAVYVTFTAADADTYSVAAVAEDSQPMGVSNGVVELCGSDLSAENESGSSIGPWRCETVFTTEANKAYTFRIMVPKNISGTVTVQVTRGQGSGFGPGGGPGGPGFTPVVDHVYLGLTNPDSVSYMETIGHKYNTSMIVGFYAYKGKDQGGQDSYELLTNAVPVYYYQDQPGQEQRDDGTKLQLNNLGNGQWELKPNCVTGGRLELTYNGNTSSISYSAQGGPQVPAGVTPTVISQLDTEVTIPGSQAPAGPAFHTTYVSFTPTETSGYRLRVTADSTEAKPMTGAVELCGDELPPTKGGGCSANPWTCEAIYELTAGKTYVYQVMVPAAGLDLSTLKAKITDEGSGGMPNLYPVPQPGWPAAGSPEEQQIIAADLTADAADIRSNLVTLSKDWNVAYVTVTPPTDGVYQITVAIPNGYLVDAPDQPMPQTFRCRQTAQWSAGGCRFNAETKNIDLADYYRLKAGRTYQFQLLLCKHGIDYNQPVLMQVRKEDCPLRAEDIFANSQRITANVKGFYNLGGSDSSVTTVNQNVVINATAPEAKSVQAASISIEAASAATLAEHKVNSATIQTNVADVSFDGDAVSKIAGTDADVLLDINTQKQSGSLTVSLNMSAGMGNPVLPESTSDQNGQVTVSVPYEAEAGNTVTVEYVRPDGTTTPVEAAYDKQSKTVTFSTNHFSDYKITEKPEPDDTVELKPGCDGKTDCPTKDYTDVKKDTWYHTEGYVDYVVTRGVMTGTGTKPLRFEPDENITRAQMVETLWKMEGKPKITAAEADKAASAFTDVNRDAWYTGSIYWAYTKGLAEGMGDQKFAPDDSMTREQMVTFLYRYAKFKGADVTAGEIPTRFSDRAKVGGFAKPAMAWAVKYGIITGMNTTPETIAPQGNASRAQLAKIMTVYLRLPA